MVNIRSLKGWEFPQAGGISHPLILDPGDEILYYDHNAKGWARVSVVENYGHVVQLVALEGDLCGFYWYEDYDALLDPMLYLNPGRHDL